MPCCCQGDDDDVAMISLLPTSANAMLPGRVGGQPGKLAQARSGKLEYFGRRERANFHKGVPSGRVHPSKVPGG